jgi:hypothetical protein
MQLASLLPMIDLGRKSDGSKSLGKHQACITDSGRGRQGVGAGARLTTAKLCWGGLILWGSWGPFAGLEHRPLGLATGEGVVQKDGQVAAFGLREHKLDTMDFCLASFPLKQEGQEPFSGGSQHGK